MKRKTLPLLALVATTLFLIACDDRSDDLKAISKFKVLTPPRFSDVVSHQDDVSEERVFSLMDRIIDCLAEFKWLRSARVASRSLRQIRALRMVICSSTAMILRCLRSLSSH